MSGENFFTTMLLYTIGFTKKTAEEFFDGIKYRAVQILIDVRLNNTSQLMGFTKRRDMKYFLDRLCNCEYQHKPEYAPTKNILDNYKRDKITWEDYERKYKALMKRRKAIDDFMMYFDFYDSVCLLCSEPTPEHCHRRLFAEMIHAQLPGTEIIHI